MPGKISNFFVASIINTPLHPMLGKNMAVITVTGSKTGKRYSTPVNVMRDGETFTVVSLRDRTWWRNLRGGNQGLIRVAGKQLLVQGEVIENHDGVINGLNQLFRKYPTYAKYFGVHLEADGQPQMDDHEREARESTHPSTSCRRWVKSGTISLKNLS
jgi:deazaflavin-dependent oxidoreductase (nitroreductase family)